MSLRLGQKLKIRAMVYVAGEPIPFFWPMRSFIHHNPLHGLERYPFQEAVERGAEIFHARGFLRRPVYQRYLRLGKVDLEALTAEVEKFLAHKESVAGIDLSGWILSLLTRMEQNVIRGNGLARDADVWPALRNAPVGRAAPDEAGLKAYLRAELLGPRPVYEAVDALYGTEVASEVDELVIKSCLDFFDEGQSVWSMPGRERGFFNAWREIARRSGRLYLRGLHIDRILREEEGPEAVIAQVMETLGVSEEQWTAYFTRELARLHGWAGFVRWRSNAKHYYWAERFPADLVDFLAVRLALAVALLSEQGRRTPTTTAGLDRMIEDHSREMYLRYELFGGSALPEFAARMERVLAGGRRAPIGRLYEDYAAAKRTYEAQDQATRLRALAALNEDGESLERLPEADLGRLISLLREFEREEGMIWLRAMEHRAVDHLLTGIKPEPPPACGKRPFAQALFCIDTRSERIRRHLESAGDYQTYGIAGFFGVPVSFMELGKGNEIHLCPVLLMPKNLVMEMAVTEASGEREIGAFTVLEKVFHELKESLLSPFVTVEAIGLLFGFDMVGKTLTPQAYNRWRRRLHQHKPRTHLLLDKLGREQADSIIRAVQRAVIAKAVAQEFGLAPEQIHDGMVRELREAAMGHCNGAPLLANMLHLDGEAEQGFIKRLRDVYRINPSVVQLQMERLARVGFSLEEQVVFVAQALKAIGLTRNFSRFVLLVGHGSTSENNPYESALDCGACGGNQGLVNARVLAQMANKAGVRRRLREQGIEIPEDTWFMPALHDTTTDQLRLFDLDRVPASHVVYMDRLRKGLLAASRLCTQERMVTLLDSGARLRPGEASRHAVRNAMDWSQVRPEWGLAGNAYFIIGRRILTQSFPLEGRAFLHSYDYRVDPKRRLLATILTGPLVVGQWINMEHYFSTVDNERFGSGSKVYHNVAGRFGVMTGNLSDLRTGLPSQTVLERGLPYHDPVRLITVIEAPFDHAVAAVEEVSVVKTLVRNGWIRLLILDPERNTVAFYEDGAWSHRPFRVSVEPASAEESVSP